MTNCDFAETVGEAHFYDDRLVAYRKRVKMESGDASWHKLTLEELIRLTSPKPKAALGHCEKKPKEIPLPHRTPLDPRTTVRRRDSSRASRSGDGLEPPPLAEARDDLNSYVVTRWCPWFSRTFEAISEENLNMLRVRILRVHGDETPLLLELLAAALLVLKLPNAPSFLLHPAAE
ncbi:hypothetical protein Q5P01_000546 [Channa striata]|uniref:Uncharacterized protein n=1 Tax=Channa striata TaxID=64152 RepID=A0AA88IKE2_CHASR|nr:hypothetical protein Q5P01_000546 [Channa striata]